MQTRSGGIGWLTFSFVALVALAAGAVGGGLAAGALTYYLAPQSSQGANASAEGQASPQPDTQVRSLKQDTAIVEAVRKVKPAVVTVATSIAGQRTRQGRAYGTGVIVDARGFIVTNNHVVESAGQIEVLFENGEKAEANLVGTDPLSDLAVLQVRGRAMPAVATLGDSSSLQVGEPVIAIGSALGDFKNTVTVGVISGLNRRLGASGPSAIEGLIQTDAAINHGNSGGPLVNGAGQVIGINTLVVRNAAGGDIAEGLGFAIPANLVKTVSAQLIERGRVVRSFLGVTSVMLNAQLASANDLPINAGAWIQDVSAGSPASRAGLRPGDVITSVGGHTLGDETPLVAVLLRFKPGDAVSLSVWRGGQTLTLSATLTERPIS